MNKLGYVLAFALVGVGLYVRSANIDMSETRLLVGGFWLWVIMAAVDTWPWMLMALAVLAAVWTNDE